MNKYFFGLSSLIAVNLLASSVLAASAGQNAGAGAALTYNMNAAECQALETNRGNYPDYNARHAYCSGHAGASANVSATAPGAPAPLNPVGILGTTSAVRSPAGDAMGAIHGTIGTRDAGTSAATSLGVNTGISGASNSMNNSVSAGRAPSTNVNSGLQSSGTVTTGSTGRSSVGASTGAAASSGSLSGGK